MSIGESHIVNAYVAGKSAPLHGQKLLVLAYRASKDKNGNESPARAPKAISVPSIDLEWIVNSVEILAPYVAEYLHSVQVSIAKSIYEEKGEGFTSLHNVDIDAAAIARFLSDTATSGRFTDAVVTSWFNT